MSVNGEILAINIDQEAQSSFTDDNDVVWQYSSFSNPEDVLAHYPVKRVKRDLHFLYKNGFRIYRVAAGEMQALSTFHNARRRYHLYTCELVFQMGCRAEFGVPLAHGLKPHEWALWIDNMPTWVQEFQTLFNQYSANGCTAGFMLANETDGYGDTGFDPIIGMTRASNVITADLGFDHRMAAGDNVYIYGNSLFADNSYVVTGAPTSTTITFASVGSNGTGTGGNIVLYPIGVLKQLQREAVRIRALTGPVVTVDLTCSTIQGGVWYSIYNSAWPYGDLRKGLLTYLDLNIYSGATDKTDHRAGFNRFVLEAQAAINAVGVNNVRLTEVNVWYDSSGIDADADVQRYWFMERIKWCAKKGIVCFAFCYRATGIPFRVPASTDVGGYWKDWFWPLINQRSPYVQTSTTSEISVRNLRENKLEHTRFSSLVNWNYGQDEQTGVFNASLVNSDLNDIVELDHDKIRIGGGDYMYPAGTAAIRLTVQAAVAKDLAVTYVLGGPAGVIPTLTDANWPAFKSFMVTEAGNAVSYGVARVSIGNELEHWQTQDGTVTDIIGKILDVYDTIHALYPDLDICYDMLQSALEFAGAPGGWIERKAEVIARDKFQLGYNIYCDEGLTPAQATVQFQTRLTDLFNAFGAPKLFISEGVLGIGLQRPASEAEQGMEIRRRALFAIWLGIVEIFLFNWRWDTAGTYNKNWPIRVGTSYKGWYPYIYDTVRPVRELGVSSSRGALDAPRKTVS